MRLNETMRRAISRVVARRIGYDDSYVRAFADQVAAVGREAELLRLPVDGTEDLQNSSGVVFFVLGASPLGTDPLA